MKFRSLMTAICVLATASIVSAAPFAYVANSGTKNVSVIDTADNTIKATVALPDTNPVEDPYAYGVAIGASGQYVYVGLQATNEVAVIDAATNTVVKRIGLGSDSPGGLAVNTAETRLYVASNDSNTLIVINVTGAGAVEVGRVTVDDSSLSNPAGVVLSTDGLKAYVANSSKGTIAEIALDETNNIYTRTTLINLGNNSQPMGLTINSTGTKLYAASLNGRASMIDIDPASVTPRAVTELPLVIGQDFALGNVSVAITPDNSKIFAPSNSTDKIYVIDGAANTVSGTTYAAIAGPLGSSVTPDGTKLFLTMNTVSAGETVQVFDTSNLSTAPAVISLPAGAKPISFGDFIGPVFPFTITSTQGTDCNILPLGTVAVNSYGRTFSSFPTSGTCEVKVDGVSVGQPSAYAFTNVAANHTIDSSPIAGTFHTLSGDWISSVGGYLVSTPAGISQHSKSAKFAANSTVTIKAATGFQVQTGTWTGACAGTVGSTCSILMDADKSFGTTTVVETQPWVPGGPIFNVTQNAYYTALSAGSPVSNDELKISTDIASLTTTGTAGVMVKMSSQWKSSDYGTKDTYHSLALTITDVAVIADDLTL